MRFKIAKFNTREIQILCRLRKFALLILNIFKVSKCSLKIVCAIDNTNRNIKANVMRKNLRVGNTLLCRVTP